VNGLQILLACPTYECYPAVLYEVGHIRRKTSHDERDVEACAHEQLV
jgi:hypothetical protein